MSVTVRVEGMEAAKAAIRRLAQLAPAKLQTELATSALAIQREAKENVPVDVGIVRANINVETQPSQVTVGVFPGSAGASYAPSLEFGSRPHFPPVAPLEEWARRHGMEPGAGFAIAKNIAEHGTPEHPFLYPAYVRERDNFVDRAKTAVIAAAGEAAS